MSFAHVPIMMGPCHALLHSFVHTHRAEAVLRVVEQELPESAALLRLSGMEITECISEVCVT